MNASTIETQVVLNKITVKTRPNTNDQSFELPF